MPFIPNLLEALGQQQPGQASANPMANQVPVTSTTASAPSAGPGPSKSGVAPTGAASSGQAPQPQTNLQQYLTANAPQEAAQANTMAGQLTNQYGQVTSDMTSGAQNFTNEVNAGYTADNPSLDASVSTTPIAVANNPTQLQQFLGETSGSYSGPQAFETTTPYATLNNEVQNAVTAAGQIGNVAGNPSGVQTYFQTANPQETPGQAQLDTALLTANPDAIQQIQTAAQPLNNLPATLTNEVAALDPYATQANTNAQQAQTAALAALETAQGTEATNLTNEQQTAVADVNAYNNLINAVIQAAGSYNLTPQTLPLAQQQVLGLTPAQIQELSTLIPITNSYYNNAPTLSSAYNMPTTPVAQPSPATTATSTDYQTVAALNTLGDQNVGTLPITSATAGQAGTFTPPTVPNVAADAQNYVSKAQNQLNTDNLNAINFTNSYTDLNGVMTGAGSNRWNYLATVAQLMNPAAVYGPNSGIQPMSLQQVMNLMPSGWGQSLIKACANEVYPVGDYPQLYTETVTQTTREGGTQTQEIPYGSTPPTGWTPVPGGRLGGPPVANLNMDALQTKLQSDNSLATEMLRYAGPPNAGGGGFFG